MKNISALGLVHREGLALKEEIVLAESPSCPPERAIILLESIFRRWDILFRIVSRNPHLKESVLLQCHCPEVLSLDFGVELNRKLVQLQAKNLTDGS